MSRDDDQSAVIAFLKSPAAWPHAAAPVACIETHGALVFMAGGETLKVRRAVKLPYLDFSTLEARRRFGEREVALNAPHAPGLYRGLVAITRQADGSLAVGGSGVVVEWAVAMARFEQEALLSSIVTHTGIDGALAIAMADAVFEYHRTAPVRSGAEDRVPAIVRSVFSSIATANDARLADAIARMMPLVDAVLRESATIRAERAANGYIRRCHGDLHLGNIVLWRGRPVPFDAIEFDEAIATIDTLYDLAFLLMDLDRSGARVAANVVLNRYLWRTGDVRDLAGLAALPVYLATRAAVRAMVGLDRARLGVGDHEVQVQQSIALLEHACSFLQPVAPRLVAIGGLSGTGKTTLARHLAPSLGRAPGALHVRSDLERKWLAGIADTQRLPAASYTAEASRAAYDRVNARAAAAVQAGHDVIVDAVFARSDERASVQALAERCGARFSGLWLTGPADVLKHRVARRTGDASDATPDVVDKQLGYALGTMTWHAIDATGSADDVASRAGAALNAGH